MEVNAIRHELSVLGKNGIGFLLSAIIIWSIITFIFLLPTEMTQKNMYMLFSTGLMFPLSVAISNLIKADWKLEQNPLGNIGLILNLAQIVYFPILIWAMAEYPQEALMIFAIITGAHFFPYGWFYDAKAYYIMAPISSLTIMVLGFSLNGKNIWLNSLAMVFLLITLTIWLYLDYKQKAKVGAYETE
ncbi:DUF7010 family protein [Aquisalibacillus elongatus]|uniref:Uncharacterized protein n=1 Tax=Aquisalibacillus elongatus TaxID=485577 RepID=A0A3N5BMZ4_9BACI|nr:hypothetical protein [Aquisalibacillus elongatus]RPF51068.1 hypothetical protein EDC24_2330 [Aquisalibacillus elongatus]